MGKLALTIFVSLFLLLILPLVMAQPFVQTSSPTIGIDIDYPKFEAVKINENFYLNIHTFNATSGLELTGASCRVHLYNSTGGERYFATIPFNATTGDYERFIDKGNFSQIGFNHFQLYCNQSGIGGFVSGLYQVTSTGDTLTDSQSSIYWLELIIFLFLFITSLYFAITIEGGNYRGENNEILSVNKLKYVKLMLIPLCYALFNWILNLALGLTTYLSLPMYEGVFSFLFLVWTKLAYPFLIVWGIIFIKMVLVDSKIRENLKRGFTPK